MHVLPCFWHREQVGFAWLQRTLLSLQASQDARKRAALPSIMSGESAMAGRRGGRGGGCVEDVGM
jgi:hypothetical protein